MKKISLRLDDDTHSSLVNLARSLGLSINAFLQQLVEQNTTQHESELDALRRAYVLLEGRMQVVAKEARYARIHTEEVIQSLVLRTNPAGKDDWEKNLKDALKREEDSLHAKCSKG